MTLGTGVALAAVWGFAAACACNRYVTGKGMWVSVIAALIATYLIVGK